jgi:NAD-dependent dihydropyrimidine dehydrogenase PreA subunit
MKELDKSIKIEVKRMAEETFEGVPREKISWDPIVDYIKCTTCGACVNYCHVDALIFEEKNGKKTTVVNPNRCIVFCRGCEPICPEGAISHPSEEKTLQVIDKLKKGKT